MSELEPPDYFELTHGELLRGGTWAREAALNAAVQLVAPWGAELDKLAVDSVLSAAEMFETWLNRPAAGQSPETQQ